MEEIYEIAVIIGVALVLGRQKACSERYIFSRVHKFLSFKPLIKLSLRNINFLYRNVCLNTYDQSP